MHKLNKIQHFLTLAFAFFALVFFSVSEVQAETNYTIAGNGAWQIIDEHGVCRHVRNNRSETVHVPTLTSSEWAAFRNNTPANIVVQECVYTYTDWSSWDACTAACGGGTEARTRTCELYGTPVDCSYCGGDCSASQACNTGACETFAWVEEAWGACTTECGVNTQARNVYCERTDYLGNKSQVTDGNCSGSKPASTQECGTIVCGFEWLESAWGSCSVACGGGVETRTVECEQTKEGATTIVADSRCTQPRPPVVQMCNEQACATYSWDPTGWSSCSETCGGGTRTRAAICRESIGNTAVSASLCNPATKPAITESCNVGACACAANSTETGLSSRACLTGVGQEQGSRTRQCNSAGTSWGGWSSWAWDNSSCKPTGSWTEGPWGACSETCGGGIQTRSVTCNYSGGCPDMQPLTTQTCNTQACPTSGPWTANPWGACSETCGGGTQTRSVSCNYDSCTGSQPSSSRSCNTQACQICTPGVTETQNNTRSCPVGLTGQEVGTSTRTCNSAGTAWSSWSSWTWDNSGCGFSCPSGAIGVCSGGEGPSGDDSCGAGYHCANFCCVPDGRSYGWRIDGYGSCSESCGGGTRNVNVVCRDDLERVVPDTHCNAGSKPATSQSCNTQDCATSGPWTAGNWSGCSATCGGGTQTRSVSCNYDSCTGSRPASTQNCNTHACPPVCSQVDWDFDGWCNGSTPQCNNFNINQLLCGSVPSGGCTLSNVNYQVNTCARCVVTATRCISGGGGGGSSAPTGPWTMGGWSSCSESCGGGTQTRSATCNYSGGCGARPPTSQSCNTQACALPTGPWSVGGWSSCSTSCGGGTQTRSVTCGYAGGCTGAQPTPLQSCNTQSCGGGGGFGGVGDTNFRGNMNLF